VVEVEVEAEAGVGARGRRGKSDDSALASRR
jgi:hypothetical protein